MNRIFVIFLTIAITIINSQLFSQIVINEFNPAPLNDEPEWIEIYNCSDKAIYYDTLFLCDAVSCKSLINFSIVSYTYCVITNDSSTLLQVRTIPDDVKIVETKIPTLNNTFDNILLRKSDLSIIDSVFYDMKWGVKGKSFERKECTKLGIKENFFVSISPDGATPGYKNSVSDFILLDSSIKAEPNPFSPFGNHKSSQCRISFFLPFDNARLEANIFQPNGIEVRNIYSGVTNSKSGFFFWDGKNDNDNLLPVGPYILLFEAYDISSESIYSTKMLIVIGY